MNCKKVFWRGALMSHKQELLPMAKTTKQFKIRLYDDVIYWTISINAIVSSVLLVIRLLAILDLI